MQLSELIDSLKLNPLAYATEWKNNHSGKVVGYMCSYVPEEIIWDSGASASNTASM